MINEHIVKDAILNIAHSPEKAQEIVQYLASLDWKEVFAEKEQKEQYLEQERQNRIQQIIANGGGYCDACQELARDLFPFNQECVYVREPGKHRYCLGCIHIFSKECDIPVEEWLRRCGKCREAFPYKQLIHHDRIKTNWGHCPECMEELIQQQSIVCVVCGQKTLEYTYQSQRYSTCEHCYVKSPYCSIVSYHNGRAKTLQLPGTLTREQWEYAVQYFGNKCAYCLRKPYEVLEHFMPLTRQGSTSATNCVPSCASCNVRKSDKHPDQFARLFPADNLTHIQEYFANLTTMEANS